MIEQPTVFVLGAGASCPYGFPTARQLRRDIVSDFVLQYEEHLGAVGPEYRLKRVAEGYPNSQQAGDFVERFRSSNTESVDLFLSRNPRFDMVGKTAICLSILQKEKSSRFAEELTDADRDWYFWLFNKLTADFSSKNDMARFNAHAMSFITFNYDRSLEYFLFDSLLHSFEGATSPDVASLLSQLKIVHVYGRTAPLEWQEKQGTLEYGRTLENIGYVTLPPLTRNINVVYDERDNRALEEARNLIKEAHKIFFLGFGYSKENLEALGLPDVLKPAHRIWGTALGFTEKEVHRVRAGFQRKSQHVVIRNCDCLALLREFL